MGLLRQSAPQRSGRRAHGIARMVVVSVGERKLASVSGTCAFGETDKFDEEINKRLGVVRSQVATTLGFFLVVGGPALIGLLVWRPDHNFGVAVGAVLGIFLWNFVDKKWREAVYNKQFAMRGGTDTYPITVSVTASGLAYEDGTISSTAKWAHVSELLLIDDTWFFLVQMSTFCHVPKRLFKDGPIERSFIAEALSFMAEAARARSEDAVKFAETGEL